MVVKSKLQLFVDINQSTAVEMLTLPLLGFVGNFADLHLRIKCIAQVVRIGCHKIKIFSKTVHSHVLYFIIIFLMTMIWRQNAFLNVLT